MKKSKRMLRKFLLLTSSALLLVSLTVGVTLAYLTDTTSVTNTFTVGKVEITMDESKVDEYGDLVYDDEGHLFERVKENTYKLLPGQEYIKDPIIHVTAESESCYLFVKIDNGLGELEKPSGNRGKAYKRIVDQMQTATYNWSPLEDYDGNLVEGVYYQAHDKLGDATADRLNGDYYDYQVFAEFAVKGDATNEQITSLDNMGISVTAYAIQFAGFDGDPYGAWVAGGWADTEADSENP